VRHNPKALIFYIANTTYKTEARKERAALRLGWLTDYFFYKYLLTEMSQV